MIESHKVMEHRRVSASIDYPSAVSIGSHKATSNPVAREIMHRNLAYLR